MLSFLVKRVETLGTLIYVEARTGCRIPKNERESKSVGKQRCSEIKCKRACHSSLNYIYVSIDLGVITCHDALVNLKGRVWACHVITMTQYD